MHIEGDYEICVFWTILVCRQTHLRPNHPDGCHYAFVRVGYPYACGTQQMQQADYHSGATPATALFMIFKINICITVESISFVRPNAFLDYTERQRGMNAIPSGMATSSDIFF